MKLGDFVHYAIGPHNGVDARATGRIIQVDTIDNFQGRELYYWVRWHSSSGRPDEQPQKYDADELEVVDRKD